MTARPSPAGEMPVLAPALRDEVLRRIGIGGPVSLDLDGLRRVYRAWCAHVGFDNVRKVVALRTGQPLPGRTAEDFFEAWLETGASATCWPSSNALYELLRALGFDARRGAGSMRDTGSIDHGTTRVAIGGGTWLVDSSMLTIEPLRLDGQVTIGSDPVFGAEAEPDAGTHVVWADFPPNPAFLPCRLLPDPITREFHLDSYEGSREGSTFNRRVYAIRNAPGEKRLIVGHSRISKTASGIERRELTRAELCAALQEEVGIGEALVRTWVDVGGLDLAFEEPAGPKPPPVTKVRPSLRPSRPAL